MVAARYLLGTTLVAISSRDDARRVLHLARRQSRNWAHGMLQYLGDLTSLDLGF
jgi:hypothetical protein